MWKTLLRLHRIMQKIGPHVIKYSKSKDLFYIHKTKYTIISSIIELNVILVCLSFSLGFKIKTSNTKSSIQFEILKYVFQSLVLALFSSGLVATWTFNRQSNASCWMMNTAQNFYRKRMGVGGTRQNDILFELIVINIGSAVCVGLLTVVFSPIFCQVTPPHYVHAILFPNEGFSYKFTGFCCIYLVTVGIFVGMKIGKLLLYICAPIYESQFMLRTAYSLNPFEPPTNFQKAVHTQRQSYLFIKEFCTFGVAFFPFIMALGLCINIVTTLVCIKFHSTIPPILTLVFGGFDIAVLVITVGLYGFAMAGPEEYDKFLLYWKRRLMRKVERKQLTSCVPIAVQIGIFFEMQRTTLLNALNQIVNFTVSLLILKT